MSDTIQHFTPGELVEALDPISRTWRRGYVASDAPYQTRSTNIGGAYVNWTDLPPNAPQEISRGGWKSERSIRRISA